MKNLLILIVLYRQSIDEAATIKSLVNLGIESWRSSTVYIWENCANEELEAQIASVPGLPRNTLLRRSKENVALSTIYNYVISTNNFDYILLMDQDSEVSQSLAYSYESAIEKNPKVSLILPSVVSRNLLVSPADHKTFKGKYWKKIKSGILPSKNMLAITSGMLIKRDVFLKVKFNEELDFYGIDTCFMLDYARNFNSVFVLEDILLHDTFFSAERPAQEMLWRFKNARRSWFIIYRRRPISLILVACYAFYSTIKMCVKYRDARFIF